VKKEELATDWDLPLKLELNVLDEAMADAMLAAFKTTAEANWPDLETSLFDKTTKISRKTRFFPLAEGVVSDDYQVDGAIRQVDEADRSAIALAKETLPKIQAAGRALGVDYFTPNAMVCNYYPDQDASVGSHADRLTRIGVKPLICGLSLGATRTFTLSKGTAKVCEIELPHNSVVWMLPGCQERFKHSVDKCKSADIPQSHPLSGLGRVSVTFRQYFVDFIAPLCLCQEKAMLKCVNDELKKDYGKHFWYCCRRAFENTDKTKTPCEYFAWLDYESFYKVKRETDRKNGMV
jgi:hypothetical protein